MTIFSVTDDEEIAPHQAKRSSDPGFSRSAFPSPGMLSSPMRLHELTMAALEEGLHMEKIKDESSKESFIAWGSWGSLKKGMTVIICVCLAVVLLSLATGHWYMESKNLGGLIQKAQLEKSEYLFREDLDALSQLVSFAHFSELAMELRGRVDSFVAEGKQAKTHIVVLLERRLANRFTSMSNEWSSTHMKSKQGKVKDNVKSLERGERIIQATFKHGVVQDAAVVTHSFGRHVDQFSGRIDELGASFETSEDSSNLVYDVLAKLLKRVKKRAEGIKRRELELVARMRPLLRNFFSNYNAFLMKYAPFETPELTESILIGLNDAWRCVHFNYDKEVENEGQIGSEEDVDLIVAQDDNVNGTDYTEGYMQQCVALVTAVLGEDECKTYSVPLLTDMVQRAQLLDHIRMIFYIEHNRRLSRSTFTHLYRHHILHYRCTTCVPEVQVATNMLSLVQTRVVHPRWLVDPNIVNKGVALVRILPEDPDHFKELLAKGRVLATS